MSLKKFQAKIGVKPDGEFGPMTLRAGRDYLKLSNEEAAHFFGQCSHESGGFKVFEENLNYSAEALHSKFRKYFPTKALAERYARRPSAIASRIYADRMGNGPEGLGDGWKYRGRGAIQLTGKTNYTLFAEYVNRPEIVENPDLVEDEYSFESAKFFFDTNRLWRFCTKVDEPAIRTLTQRVNGGFHGLEDRILKTNRYYRLLRQN